MKEHEIEYPKQVASNLYVEHEIGVRVVFDGACFCGDSVQTICVAVPDHGVWKKAYIGWCVDCQRVCASLVTEEIVPQPFCAVQLQKERRE